MKTSTPWDGSIRARAGFSLFARRGSFRFFFLLALSLLFLLPNMPRGYAEGAAEGATESGESGKRVFNALSKNSAACLSCHRDDSHGLVQQWGASKHYGANVGCYECHQAAKGDPDAIMHKKYLISVLVTPKDCGRCHEVENKQFQESRHAKAGSTMAGSASHALATQVESNHTEEGDQAATAGCVQCHGSTVKLTPSGKLQASTWPNSGIGRINPDGSLGTCTACHQQHDFSAAQVRRPEACSRCHQGPSHPQMEIYGQSRHGASFATHAHKMNLDSPKWIPGQDYYSGPTCATCHISPSLDVGMTHNVDKRLSWNLAQPISKQSENAEEHRKEMQSICISCHTERVVTHFYEQFDAVVALYNSKFGEPGSRLMAALLKAGLRSERPFDEAIEWSWFKLWHQAGRQAQQGAAMRNPEISQQGFADVAELFERDLLPQAEALISKAEAAGRSAELQEVKKLLEEIKNDPARQRKNGQ
ncbi:MAG: hydroxylamine oxidoreductase [Magnetococcales bacterium]|nr:hydroxylamine oxidoreductase [Magnetococcales bacterium]